MLKEIKKFYNKTKFDFSKKDAIIPKLEWPKNWVKIYFKTYPRMPKLNLSKFNPKTEIEYLLKSRSSKREFDNSNIEFSKLNKILYYSLGIKEESENFDNTRRFYPSAGGRYPIEAYFISNNIDKLPKGLYHYNIKSNQLEQLLNKNLLEESREIFENQPISGGKSFLILTSVISRSEVKYGENAYKFSLLECGHIGQNLSLMSEKEKIGCCAIGGFDNDKLENLLDLTEDELPLYSFAFGNPI